MSKTKFYQGCFLSLALVARLQAPINNASAESHEKAIAGFKGLPLGFEWNSGQTDARVKAFARGPGYALFLTSQEAVITLSGSGHRKGVVRWKPLNANPDPKISALEPLSGSVNYFIGNDPKKWRRDVVPFAKVRYSEVYPGIDLLYHGNQDQLEYDFVVAPRMDPASIALSIEGADRLRIDGGNLVMETPAGALFHHKPYIYQDIGGRRIEVSGNFVLDGNNRLRFSVGDYDHTQTLVVDPSLSFSTYLGGSGDDHALAVTVDSLGNTFVAGATASMDFPTTASAPNPHFAGGNTDGFVTVYLLAKASKFFISTYLGGSGDDEVDAIAVVHSPPEVYLAGTTTSTDLVTVGAIQPNNAGGSDAFVAKVTFPGTIAFATYFGGSGNESATGIALDGQGNILFTGKTNSTDLPLKSPIQNANAGGYDGFLAQLTNVGAPLTFSSYLGGSFDDTINAIALDKAGIAYLAGATMSSNFGQPSQAGHQIPHNGVATAINIGTGQAVYTRIFGYGVTVAKGIVAESDGNIFVTGYTSSHAFPVTPNTIQSKYGGGPYDAFLTKFKSNGQILFSTYFGGSGADLASSVGIDSKGNVVFAGGTTSTDFPTASPTQAANKGGADGFVVQVKADLTGLGFSTYLGGSGTDTVLGMRVGAKGNVVVVGSTDSTDFPTTQGVLQTSNKGKTDAFATRITFP
jgi:hypothetical protein